MRLVVQPSAPEGLIAPAWDEMRGIVDESRLRGGPRSRRQNPDHRASSPPHRRRGCVGYFSLMANPRLLRVGVLAASLALFAPSSAPLLGQSAFGGADVYRSKKLDSQVLQSLYRAPLDSLATAIESERFGEAGEVLRSLERRLTSALDPALLHLSMVQYFERDMNLWYLTVDIVDRGEEHRLAFDEPPTSDVPGTNAILEPWRTFARESVERRSFWTNAEPCPALHCLFSFESSASSESTLRAVATEHSETLARIIVEDRDEEDRADAVFLLAHDVRRPAVVRDLLLERTGDPSDLVRNNIMRVLGFMASFRTDIDVPLEPVLRALDGPYASDRNKALFILQGLATRDPRDGRIAREAGSILVRMLELQQPNHRELALDVLTRISGLDHDADDLDAWHAWLSDIPPPP